MRKFYSISIFLISLALVAFGVWIVFNPTVSLRVFTLSIGILLLIHGVVEMISFVEQRKIWNISFIFLVNGLLSLVVGGITLFVPDLAEQTFVYIFAIWLLLSSLIQMYAAFSLRDVRGWGWLFAVGVIIFVFAIASLLSKMTVAFVVSLSFGLYFIVQGIGLFVIWLLLRRVTRRTIYRD